MSLPIMLSLLAWIQVAPSGYPGALRSLVNRSAEWVQEHSLWDGTGPVTVDVDAYRQELLDLGLDVEDEREFRAAAGFEQSTRMEDVVLCPERDEGGCHVRSGGMHVGVESLSPSSDGRSVDFMVGVAITTHRPSSSVTGVCQYLLRMHALKGGQGEWVVDSVRPWRQC